MSVTSFVSEASILFLKNIPTAFPPQISGFVAGDPDALCVAVTVYAVKAVKMSTNQSFRAKQ